MNAFLIGLQFFTRIHLYGQKVWENEEFGKSVTYLPAIGFVIGACLSLIYFLLTPFHMPYFTAFILVAGEFIITGAMHADGLMDTCDGLFSGRSRERTLEIMKDSRIGSFGLIAFVFIVLFKTFALAAADSSLYLILLAMPMIGRLNMCISICEYPYARPAGIGKAFAVYRQPHAVLIAFVTALVPAAFFGMTWLFIMGTGLLAGLFVNRWVMEKIQGMTGDTYGCVCEVSEAFMAFVFVLLTRGDLWHM